MSVRQEKVQEQLVQEISEIIRRDLSDPRLGFITLTGAEISRTCAMPKCISACWGMRNRASRV